MIIVIKSVEAFRTDVIVFIGDVIMCLKSDLSINMRMRVMNWSNTYVDQGQFSDQDFILAAHIKGKTSNLPINYSMRKISNYIHVYDIFF